MSQPYSVLIVDAQSTAESLQSGLSDTPYSIPLIVSQSGESARSTILDRRIRLAGIILNPVITTPGALPLISLAHHVRPVTPIHLLYDRKLPFSREEMDRLAVTDAVNRFHLEDMLRERFAPEIFQSGLPESAEPAQRTPEPQEPLDLPTDLPMDLIEEGFLAVPATDFLTGSPGFFDVHVRLPSGRFLKIVEAKDVFLPKRVLSYISKGVRHFYLKRESHSRCLSYCDVMAKQVLTHRAVSPEVKISEAFNRGQEITSLIQAHGYREEHSEFIRSFLTSARSAMQDLKLDDQESVGCLMNHLVAYDHAVSTTMVAALLTLPLNIESANAYQIVGIASFLHDIGLYQLPASLRHEDQESMTPEERELFRQHPRLGAELLAGSTRLDTSILQAIAQHHERRDNLGFPGQANPSEINRVAEIVGISDAFVSLLAKARRVPGLDPLKEMDKQVFHGYSYPVIEGFRKIFMKARDQ